MNSKQRKTLAKILERPARPDIKWTDFLSLMAALGVESDHSRAGSRVGFHANECDLVVHKPHPGKELTRPAIRGIQQFLENAGV
ncbi:MAG: hypothetical protein DRP64_08880 [Verrucomicrobia bacterium]|nr:MAG: hypothetical protein DRP64_08880 [Verrucomicrobiota bacterium]